MRQRSRHVWRPKRSLKSLRKQGWEHRSISAHGWRWRRSHSSIFKRDSNQMRRRINSWKLNRRCALFKNQGCRPRRNKLHGWWLRRRLAFLSKCGWSMRRRSRYLLNLFSIWLSLVYAMIILNLSVHTTGTPGGNHIKWLHNYNCPSYPLIIRITETRGLIYCLLHWKPCRASVESPIKPYIFRPSLITQKTM